MSAARRVGAALALLASLALAVAGCGGGGTDSTAEATARKQLEAGAAKLEAARTLSVSLVAEGEEEGSDPEKVGCIEVDADKGKPERFEMRVDLSCSGGPETPTMVSVGRHAWATNGAEGWTAAEISPSYLHQLQSEQTDLKHLLGSAHDIEAVSGEDAVEERAAGGEAKTEFRFGAPASAFPDIPDVGLDNVDFEATVNGDGVLEEIVIHASKDGAGARVVETFRNVDHPLDIQPPAADEVHGTVAQINSQADLDALLGVSF